MRKKILLSLFLIAAAGTFSFSQPTNVKTKLEKERNELKKSSKRLIFFITG